MSADTILAIDLGKYKCVACVNDRATAAADYRAVTTSRSAPRSTMWRRTWRSGRCSCTTSPPAPCFAP